MRLPVVLVALLVIATAAFVIGVSAERSQGETHTDGGSEVRTEGAESGGEAHAETTAGAHADEGKTETFLGVDYEAVPFIVLAAAFSLALAAAVWLRPASVPLLALVVVAMVAFAALDVREVVHQLDEDNGGLALLAGVVAALHLGVAAVALALARRTATSSRPLA
jgi:hypothetical protein